MLGIALGISWLVSLGPAGTDGINPVIGGFASWHVVLLLPILLNIVVGIWLIVRARSPK